MKIQILFFLIYIGCSSHILYTYMHRLPRLKLGFNNILDGGHVRPPGHTWFWFQYFEYYNAQKMLNNQGQPANGLPSPTLNELEGLTQITWQQRDPSIGNLKIGFSVYQPYLFYSKTTKNIELYSTGAGFGDTMLGPFLQSVMMMYRNRPFFVHRLELDFSFPAGKYRLPPVPADIDTSIRNPGNGFYVINPYWAATFHFTSKMSATWRLNYLWNSKNKHDNSQMGQLMYLNFSAQYMIIERFWVGIIGYYLEQLTNNKLNNIPVPNFKARLVAVGPGAAYSLPNGDFFWWYIYFENNARNTLQGIRSMFRFFIIF